ncbi:hypothetical protein JSQ80_14775 [Paenibacillus apiarius]|nr:hypothetical protein [Paenibacillus apiarius]
MNRLVEKGHLTKETAGTRKGHELVVKNAYFENILQYFALACVGVDIEKMLFRFDDWNSRAVLIPSIDEQRKIVFI